MSNFKSTVNKVKMRKKKKNYSIFQSDLNAEKLKTLFKKGSKTASKNYRPISLLSLLSEIIQNVIHGQIQSFLNKNNIICRYHSDFH